MNEVIERTEIDPRLVQVFREVFEDNALELTEDTGRSNIAAWDSGAHIQLILAIEQTFRIKFDMADFSKFNNVGELWRLIEEKISDAS